MLLRPVSHYGRKRVQQSRSADPKVGMGGCRQKEPRVIWTMEQLDAEQTGVGELREPLATLHYAGNRGGTNDAVLQDDNVSDLSCV